MHSYRNAHVISREDYMNLIKNGNTRWRGTQEEGGFREIVCSARILGSCSGPPVGERLPVRVGGSVPPFRASASTWAHRRCDGNLALNRPIECVCLLPDNRRVVAVASCSLVRLLVFRFATARVLSGSVATILASMAGASPTGQPRCNRLRPRRPRKGLPHLFAIVSANGRGWIPMKCLYGRLRTRMTRCHHPETCSSRMIVNRPENAISPSPASVKPSGVSA